jgi:hypothetical protein
MNTILKDTLYLTLTILVAGLITLSLTSMAFAHGGGTVDPADANCMGQLASMHANGKNPGNNPDTQNGFGTDQNHGGLEGPYDSIKAQAKAFKAFCNSDLE